jgi:hypothetical protein
LIKAIASLLAGCLLGAGAMYFAMQAPDRAGSPGPGSGSFIESVADFALGRDGAVAAPSTSVADSLAAYRAAGLTGRADVRQALETAASAPWSPARDVEIDALLARFSDLAPAEAAVAARQLGLETRFVADAYVHWAEQNPAAAVAGLAAIESRDARNDVALALLDILGDDSAGFRQVAAGLPESDRAPLEIAWISLRAESDPYGAFREAQSLAGTRQTAKALEQVAIAWASQEPLGAIAQADVLEEPYRSQYLASVFREWAQLDPTGYLAWLQSSASPPDQAVIGLSLLAGTNPDLVMSVAGGLSGNLRQSARLIAMQAIAEADPEAAMARIAATPPGQEREIMMMSVGAALARRDPDAAIAWAESLPAPSPNLMMQVVISIVRMHPERATQLLENPPRGTDPALMALFATTAVASNPDQAPILADRLVASDSIQSANALRGLITNWAQQDPERALDWVLAHESQVNANVLGGAAQSIAAVDPVAAAGYVERIPLSYRPVWIAQVAGPYGFREPAAALAWVAQFQGQDVYDSALGAVINGVAQVDPRAAAQAVSQAGPQVQLSAAPSVAAALAREDPRAAARFAESLADERASRSAIAMTVATWAVGDLGAAQSYALGLDRGETRDQALDALIRQSAQSPRFERSLLDAFSSDRATQDALERAIPLVSRQDPAEAQELLRRVTSPEARRRIEEQIEQLDALPR